MRAKRTELRIAGTGGQGLILSAKMLADALAATGKRAEAPRGFLDLNMDAIEVVPQAVAAVS